MDLAELVASWPLTSIACNADNPDLLKYLSNSPISGRTIRLRYDRSPDFFKLLHYQADRHVTFISRNSGGTVTGMGSVSVREGYLHGAPTPVGFLSDLRISPDRGIALNWHRYYQQLLEQSHTLKELDGCSHFVTAVIDSNAVAQQSLIVPKRKPGYTYDLLAKYVMVNILGPIPSLFRPRDSKPPPGYTVTQGSADDLDELTDFLEQQHRCRPFGYCFRTGELERRLRVWDSPSARFALNQFIIMRGARGRIRGCLAPWAPTDAKTTFVDRFAFKVRLLRLIGRVLTGIKFPKHGQALRILYLTHVETDLTLPLAERQRVFRAMLDHVVDSTRNRDWHILAFADFVQDPLATDLAEYVTYRVPMALYQVRSSRPEPRGIASPFGAVSPGFEIALV
ncbi:MAG: hypothetical protein HXY51_10870 [Nitrospirae bacterium]|nr:hypothetical protein [Nitrospirota bacterium]